MELERLGKVGDIMIKHRTESNIIVMIMLSKVIIRQTRPIGQNILSYKDEKKSNCGMIFFLQKCLPSKQNLMAGDSTARRLNNRWV